MVAKDTVKDTPDGDLVLRKDTSNRGGCSAKDKLGEDIYVLYQYLEGDKSLDITKMFTDKSRKKSVCVPGVMRDPSRDESPGCVDMKDFCLQLLAEMRQDRDLLFNEIADLKRDNYLLRKVQEDISGIRLELTNTRDRVSKLEAYSTESRSTLISADTDSDQNDYEVLNKKHNQVTKSVRKLQKSLSTVEQSIVSIRNAGKELSVRVASNNSSITSRLNNMELSRPTSKYQRITPELSPLGNMTSLKKVTTPPPMILLGVIRTCCWTTVLKTLVTNGMDCQSPFQV
jgi:prefoldin subunit 5